MNQQLAEPLVSLVVPIYNTGAYLPLCIASIQASSCKAIQIVLVNDGSTDDSGQICDNAALTDSRITVIHQENAGLIAARLAGLGKANAKYVCYVDGDDWVEPGFVEELLEIALQDKSDVVIGGHAEDLAGCRETLINTIPAGYYSKESLRREVVPRMLNTGKFSEFGIFSYVWGKLFRRDLLQESQMCLDRSIGVGEDAACLYPMILQATSVSITHAANYVYRQRTNSMIKTADAQEIIRLQRVYDFLQDRFTRLNAWEVMRPQVISYILSLAVVRCTLSPASNNDQHLLSMFPGCAPGERIALYGAGTFGQFLAQRIQRDPLFSLAAWTDPRWSIYAKQHLNVVSPELLKRDTWDRLLICYVEETNAMAAAQKLTQEGIPIDRISRIEIPSNVRESFLNAYGLQTAGV